MISHPDLHWETTGQSIISGELAQYLSRFEQALLELAVFHGCRIVSPASTLSPSVLKKIDYLHSFPQHATFACCLERSHTNLNTFCDQEAIADDRINVTALAPVQALLLPAACYSLYPLIKSQPEDEDAQFFTVQSRCFRAEEIYLPLERQWNFSMRELVCAGTEAQVSCFLDVIQQEIATICDDLHLPVTLCNATDPFFNPEKNPQYIMQRIAPSKTEVVYGDSLAIASLNFHRQYFGEAFDIRYGEDYCYTACVAFGLERWLAAMFKHHGDQVSTWPTITTLSAQEA